MEGDYPSFPLSTPQYIYPLSSHLISSPSLTSLALHLLFFYTFSPNTHAHVHSLIISISLEPEVEATPSLVGWEIPSETATATTTSTSGKGGKGQSAPVKLTQV